MFCSYKQTLKIVMGRADKDKAVPSCGCLIKRLCAKFNLFLFVFCKSLRVRKHIDIKIDCLAVILLLMET